jgi:hypothetical protein
VKREGVGSWCDGALRIGFGAAQMRPAIVIGEPDRQELLMCHPSCKASRHACRKENKVASTAPSRQASLPGRCWPRLAFGRPTICAERKIKLRFQHRRQVRI